MSKRDDVHLGIYREAALNRPPAIDRWRWLPWIAAAALLSLIASGAL